MEVVQIREGLWRWTADHPLWRPESGGPTGWEKTVASYYYEPGTSGGVILFDPQVPTPGTEDAARFWRALDRDVKRRGGPVHVLLGVHHHARSAGEVVLRYAGPHETAIWAPAGAEDRVHNCTVTHPFQAGAELPGGIRAHFVEGMGAPEVVYEVPEHRALVAADAILGAGSGEVRLAPESWGEDTEAGQLAYRERFRPSLRPLGEVPVDLILVTHGEIVSRNAGGALRQALDGAPWGS